MNNRESPLFWSFPCGTWFATRIRVSLFFPLMLLPLWYHLGARIGVVFCLILFVSILLHELGHVVAARMTGGFGSEILIWPLGGLAFVQPADSFRSKMFTIAAGPIVNLLLCAITFGSVFQSGMLENTLNPLIMPAVELKYEILSDLLVLIFFANWIALLANLIPVYPLDGGRMLQTILTNRFGGETGSGVYIRIGTLIAFVVMIAGLMLSSTWLVFIGAIVLVLNLHEAMMLRASDNYDDSFMGYDFSQGYTSLESSEKDQPPRRAGFMKRWVQKRRDGRTKRLQNQEVEAELKLDELLEKVHTQGIEALSEAERRQLNTASARIRDKSKKDR